MIMYRTDYYGTQIDEVQVKKTTPQFAILPSGRREVLRSGYSNYFPTREYAHAYLRSQLELKVAKAEAYLAIARTALAKVNEVGE